MLSLDEPTMAKVMRSPEYVRVHDKWHRPSHRTEQTYCGTHLLAGNVNAVTHADAIPEPACAHCKSMEKHYVG